MMKTYSMRLLAICAIHCLNGSAFGDGIDWMMRKICLVLATSVRRILLSSDGSFNWLQIVTGWFCSLLILFFRTFQ